MCTQAVRVLSKFVSRTYVLVNMLKHALHSMEQIQVNQYQYVYTAINSSLECVMAKLKL